MVVGFLRLSTMEPSTSALARSLDMLILGLGIGLVMQVLVLAVQNDVDYRDLGVATSGATFFRSIGGCFGVAICGAIFSNRLAAELASLGPAAAVGSGRVTRDRSPSCRPPRAAFVGAYADALTTVFLVCAPIAARRLRARLAAAREAAAAHGRGARRGRGLRGAQARGPGGGDRARALDAGAARHPRADPRAPVRAGGRST